VKSRGKPGEKSEEAIVLMTIETTQLGEREGPLLGPWFESKWAHF
jgi:hypothetical protein